jgi:hypothetical protein
MDKHSVHGFSQAIDKALKLREIQQLVTIVSEENVNTERLQSGLQKELSVDSQQLVSEKRELLLKLVRAEYNEMIDNLSIILPPERHKASRHLLNSTLIGLDDLSGLGDWEYIESAMKANRWKVALYSGYDWVTKTLGMTSA